MGNKIAIGVAYKDQDLDGSTIINSTVNTASTTDTAKIVGITNGLQAAGKAVVADSNVNTGISKVTQLHIGTSGSETQVTSTAAELNTLAGVTAGTTTASKALVVDASKNITGLGSVLSTAPTGSGIGYATGAGGAVTQITSRTTGVTLSKLTGKITTDTTSLAAEASADFIVTNTTVALGDVVVVAIQSGSNSGGTIVSVSNVTAGSFSIRVHNGNVAAGTAETGAIIINFAVIKAVAA